MKFYYAVAVWLIMGLIIGAGILMAVAGKPWLFILSLLGFIVAVGKIGCSTH